MKKVLVLDANQRSALATIRSLGKHGLHVVAADQHLPSIGSVSAYAAAAEHYPDPNTDPARFVAEIAGIIRRHSIDIVMPMTDVTTMLLLAQPEYVQPARLACATRDSYEALTDKRRLVELADSLGIPTPRTIVALDAERVRQAAAELGYPLVLKPARSRYLRNGQVVSTAVRPVRSATELESCLARLDWLADLPCLVQQFVGEYGAGTFAICGADGPIAWFAHVRIREKPPSGGVSVLSESAAVDARLREHSARLLSAARWTGIAMVEFRVAGDGTPYLMEVNGRFWGSLQLAIDAGVDFPWLLYQLVSGSEPRPPATYVTGRRLRWLLGDVDNLLLRLRDSRLAVRARLRACGEFCATFFDFKCRQELFRWSDPRPALLEARQWLGAVLK